MRMPGNNHCNYMAGLFIPLQKLLEEKPRREKWVYGMLGDVEWGGVKQ